MNELKRILDHQIEANIKECYRQIEMLHAMVTRDPEHTVEWWHPRIELAEETIAFNKELKQSVEIIGSMVDVIGLRDMLNERLRNLESDLEVFQTDLPKEIWIRLKMGMVRNLLRPVDEFVFAEATNGGHRRRKRTGKKRSRSGTTRMRRGCTRRRLRRQ
jgi:hypothetical protein